MRVEDFGIRGVHLAYELLEGYDALVLVDAVPMGEPPGTLAVIEPELDSAETSGSGGDVAVVDAHTMSPDVVLATLRRLGGRVERILVVGCQPADLEDGMGLTPAVAAAVEDAAELCFQLVSEMVEPVTKGAFHDPSPVCIASPRRGGRPGDQVVARHRALSQNEGDVDGHCRLRVPRSDRRRGAPRRGAVHQRAAGYRPVLQDPEDVARVPRYRITPERSYVWIDARSNVHPIHSTTDGLEGFVDLTFSPDGSVDFRAPVAGTFR